ncbi:LuxR C-terminal-related transcriptional regulator [Jiulongibacter sp. NS-SX5]|uniref:LuxR C-terminal-related transcriptional regulator n=1 Tax=Jiulongibacter sp. NS-SX5 TaxID=3463854 RepID=UPI004058F882
MNATILIGGYLGLIFFLCITQVFIYLLYNKKSSLYYFFYTLSCAIGLLLEPGFEEQQLFSIPFSREINLLAHVAVPWFGALFAINYLAVQHKKQHYIFFTTLLSAALILYGFHYPQNEPFTYFLLAGDIIAILILGFYFVHSIIHYSHTTSKFFIGGFSFSFLFSFDYFFLEKLNIPFLHTTEFTLMLAGVLEAIFTTFAIFYTIKNENATGETVNYSLPKKALNRNISELKNQYQLSERELEVLDQILLGKSNSDIGESLFISLHTVKYHSKNLYAKLEVKNRNELFQRFL